MSHFLFEGFAITQPASRWLETALNVVHQLFNEVPTLYSAEYQADCPARHLRLRGMNLKREMSVTRIEARPGGPKRGSKEFLPASAYLSFRAMPSTSRPLGKFICHLRYRSIDSLTSPCSKYIILHGAPRSEEEQNGIIPVSSPSRFAHIV